MPKYYVSSCDFKAVVSAPTAKEGAIKAFARDASSLKGRLSEIVVVSEHGGDSYRDEDVAFSTNFVLREAGLEHLFEDVKK